MGERSVASLLLVVAALLPLGWPSPVSGADEVGADDFRISRMGPDGSTAYGAFWFLVFNMRPTVAYNSTDNEYLVVWYGDDDTGSLVDNEWEVFGRRIDAETGQLLGGFFRISFMGPDGNVDYGALFPAVTYNPNNNEYLVVWVGDDNTGPLVNDEFEIFGRRVSASGALLGSQTRMSHMGPDGSTAFGAAWWVPPDVAYNATDNSYCVVWTGDDNTVPLIDEEFEIRARRFAAATLASSDATNGIRISYMGFSGTTAFGATSPAVTWNSIENKYLIVWTGDDNAGAQVDEAFEVWGQLLHGSSPVFLEANFRISYMGMADNDPAYDGLDPDVAYNETLDIYYVVWIGDDDRSGMVDEDFEVWGVLVNPDTTLNGLQWRISTMGQFGSDPAYTAFSPAVVNNEYMDRFEVVWHGDHNYPINTQVDGEFEVFLQGISADPFVANLLQNQRLTTMGPPNDPLFGAFDPAIAYDSSKDGALVVWWGDNHVGTMVDDEFEVFGQRLRFGVIFADGFESGNTSDWSASVP